MRRASGAVAGFAVGGLVGLGTILAIGATSQPGRPYPRYSIEPWRETGFLVTDNDNDNLFFYLPSSDEPGDFVYGLTDAVDLEQVGQKQLRKPRPTN